MPEGGTCRVQVSQARTFRGLAFIVREAIARRAELPQLFGQAHSKQEHTRGMV